MRAQSLHPSPHHPQRLQANPVHPTAFFTSLRANLHLTETTDPFLSLSPSSTDMSSSSAASTPPSLPTNPSSSSPLATATIPDLTTAPTATPASRLAALHLVADSVAQQRQSASRALIFHPLVLAAFVAVLALVAQLLYESRGDLALVATTWAGLVMAGLVGVRWAVSEYIEVAEGIGWRWLEDGGKLEGEGEDVVVVSWWGEEVIGALVVRLVREEHGSAGGAGAGAGAGGGKAGRRSRAGKGTYTAYIRAWTVKLRFRGKGVGTGLLEEAVRICHERGVDALEFAADHASTSSSLFLISPEWLSCQESNADGRGAIDSARVLPSIFNGGFERREARARKMLDEVVRAQGGLGGRKR